MGTGPGLWIASVTTLGFEANRKAGSSESRKSGGSSTRAAGKGREGAGSGERTG